MKPNGQEIRAIRTDEQDVIAQAEATAQPFASGDGDNQVPSVYDDR